MPDPDIYNPEVIKSTPSLALIKVVKESVFLGCEIPAKYCVRVLKKGWRGKAYYNFAVLNRNGVTYEFESLCDDVSMSDYNQAERVFNALAIQRGEPIVSGGEV